MLMNYKIVLTGNEPNMDTNGSKDLNTLKNFINEYRQWINLLVEF